MITIIKKQVISRVLFISIKMGNHLSGTGITSQPQAALISRFLMVINPLSLAPSRGLPSQHFSMLLVRSYHTLAPLPYIKYSAVCFCGTILTVTRTGNYPASLTIWEPGLSSKKFYFENKIKLFCDCLSCFHLA